MARIGKLSALVSLFIALVIPTWAQRPIGPSVIAPGTATGLASAPSTQPGFSVNLSGGSIADGTYYCKTTNWNQRGETTGSPTRTIAVTGGGGAAKINIGDADFFWLTGAPGFRIYCSSDNVTFYRQTPNPVVADFMIDSFTHYNRMGSFGARLTSLTFSGTTIPITNTATIDPLQVALNATRRAPTGASAPVPFGTLFVPAIDGTVNPSAQFNLTTPLVAMKGDRIIGSGAQNSNVDKQTRIFDDGTWSNTKLGVVMVFGGDTNIANVGIQGISANGLMIIGGAGYQGGSTGGMSVSDVALRAATGASTYRALVLVGILYHSFFNNISILGTGDYAIEWRNVAGGEHYFQGGRWDTSGAGIMKSVPGWTDPDNGAHDAGFPFGVSGVTIKNVLTEGGTGILWDCVGLQIIFELVQNADTAIAPGTDSIAKFGTDATYGGTTNITLINTSFGTPNNARVGTNLVGTQQIIRAFGTSHFGWGNSTGSQQTVDFNSIAGMQVYDYAGAIGSIDDAAAATTPHVINKHDNTFFRAVLGDAGGGASVVPWNVILGRLEFIRKSGGNATRADRGSILNTGTALELRALDDATYLAQFPVSTASGNVINLRNNTRVNATSGAASTLFIGPSASTAAGGTIASISAFNFQVKGSAADIVLWAHAQPAGVESFSLCGTNCVKTTTAKQIESTLATGTAPFSTTSTTVVPNLNVSQLLGKTWAIPDPIGATTPAAVTGTLYSSATDCTSSASPAACGAAASGSFVIAAAATGVVVNTTAVTANSKIFIQEDSSLGTKLSVTCNTQSILVLGPPVVTARTAATSFTATIVVAPTTDPACYSYWIVGP